MKSAFTAAASFTAVRIAFIAVLFVLGSHALAGGKGGGSLWDEIDRVDREDMRTKSGVVEGDTLTLRVEDHKRSRGRPFIYGKDVAIDVSSLEESHEIAAGDDAVRAYSDMGDAALLDAMVAGDAEQHRYTTAMGESLAAADRVLRRDFNLLAGEQRRQAHALDELGARVGSVEHQVADLQAALDGQRRRYREAIAATTAIGMVQQDPSASGVQLSVGGGWFQGQQAGAVVAGTRIADRVYVNAGASFGAVTTYGASATVRLGGDLFVTKRRASR